MKFSTMSCSFFRLILGRAHVTACHIKPIFYFLLAIALNCTNGRVYKSCGPLNEPSCGSAIESDSFNCREGCFCPEGTMLNDGICVKAENCPCRLKGRVFPPKSIIKKDCNTCECQGGNWKCTSITCGSRCAAIGDPHYSTFDGKRYDFMGKCSYYLMQTREMSVEAENVACSGAISENMNFLPSFTTEMPSCTKSLTIKFNDDAGQLRVIKLKQGGFVLLDGFEVPKLPRELSNGAVKIRQASSSFVIGKEIFLRSFRWQKLFSLTEKLIFLFASLS